MLASKADLQRVAGFAQPSFIFLLGGGGQDKVAVWWTVGFRHVVLLVSTNHSVRRASPVRAGRPPRSWAFLSSTRWSPSGRRLFELWEATSPPGYPFEHDHCLDSRRQDRGYQRLCCVSHLRVRLDLLNPGRDWHFGSLVWAPSGRRGLLDDGLIITSNGEVIDELKQGYPVPGFRILWTPPSPPADSGRARSAPARTTACRPKRQRTHPNSRYCFSPKR